MVQITPPKLRSRQRTRSAAQAASKGEFWRGNRVHSIRPNPEGAARGDNIAKPTERVQVIVMKGLAWMLHEERTGTAEHRAKTNGVMEN